VAFDLHQILFVCIAKTFALCNLVKEVA